jgi:hypothetical protein
MCRIGGISGLVAQLLRIYSYLSVTIVHELVAIKSVPSFINPARSPPGKFNKMCSMQRCIRGFMSPPPNMVTQDARGWLVTNDDWTGSFETTLIGVEYLR